MRGHWVSNTRKFNKHYQSAKKNDDFRTYFLVGTRSISDGIWDNFVWDSTLGLYKPTNAGQISKPGGIDLTAVQRYYGENYRENFEERHIYPIGVEPIVNRESKIFFASNRYGQVLKYNETQSIPFNEYCTFLYDIPRGAVLRPYVVGQTQEEEPQPIYVDHIYTYTNPKLREYIKISVPRSSYGYVSNIPWGGMGRQLQPIYNAPILSVMNNVIDLGNILSAEYSDYRASLSDFATLPTNSIIVSKGYHGYRKPQTDLYPFFVLQDEVGYGETGFLSFWKDMVQPGVTEYIFYDRPYTEDGKTYYFGIRAFEYDGSWYFKMKPVMVDENDNYIEDHDWWITTLKFPSFVGFRPAALTSYAGGQYATLNCWVHSNNTTFDRWRLEYAPLLITESINEQEFEEIRDLIEPTQSVGLLP